MVVHLCAIFLQIGASLWHFQTNNVIIGKLHNHQLTSSCLVTMMIANKKRKHHCRLVNIFILISIEWRCRSVLCWTSSLFDEISYKMCVCCACTNIQWWIFSIYHVLLLRQPCLSRRYYYMIVVAVTAIVLLSSLYIALFVYGCMCVCFIYIGGGCVCAFAAVNFYCKYIYFFKSFTSSLTSLLWFFSSLVAVKEEGVLFVWRHKMVALQFSRKATFIETLKVQKIQQQQCFAQRRTKGDQPTGWYLKTNILF